MKNERKKLFIRFMRFFVKSDIHKKKCDQKQYSCNNYVCAKIQKIIHNFSRSSSVLTDASKNTIPANISHVNTTMALGAARLVKFGVRNASTKYPAEKLVNNPERDFSQGLVKNIVIKIVAGRVRIYNYALTKQQILLDYNQGSAVRFGPTTGRP